MAHARIFKGAASALSAGGATGKLPQVDKARATALYVCQSKSRAGSAYAESRTFQLALQDSAHRLRGNDLEAGVRLFDLR